MRGDVQIIEGKLCYAFDVSDAWLKKLNDRSRFFKGKDEWKVKSIVDGTAWCYQINPFGSTEQEIERLSRKVEKIEGWINEIIRKENARSYDEMIEKPTLKLRVKCFINWITRGLTGMNLFKITYSEAYRVVLYPIFRLK